MQLLVEDRRVPEIVARAQPDTLGVGGDRHVADHSEERLDIVTGGGGLGGGGGHRRAPCAAETGIRSPARQSRPEALSTQPQRVAGKAATKGRSASPPCGFSAPFAGCHLPGHPGAVSLGKASPLALLQGPEKAAYLLLGNALGLSRPRGRV